MFAHFIWEETLCGLCLACLNLRPHCCTFCQMPVTCCHGNLSCQLDKLERGNLNWGIASIGLTYGHFLITKFILKGPAHCRWYHSLSRESQTIQEGYVNMNLVSSNPPWFLRQDPAWVPVLSSKMMSRMYPVNRNRLFDPQVVFGRSFITETETN